jgi:protease-4
MDDAIAKAAQLAKLGDERGIRYLEPAPSFREELIATLASDGSDDTAVPEDAFASLARAPQQQLAAMLGEVRSILAGPSIQARCLECPASAPVPLAKRDFSLLGLIEEWLA